MNEYLEIRGAREHNLKNISLNIPRDKLTVITGLSGSGKSSLAFDTIYAEGQRRYVESLTSYARQFLGQMDKPDVDAISGLSPAISIDQKTTGRNPRSTVGTVTEIHDYLRLLWARVGVPHCPVCGREIRKQSVDEIVDAVCAAPEGTRMQILSPLVRGRKGEHKELLNSARKSGYVRARVDGTMYDLEDTPELDKKKKHTIELVVDRLIRRETDDFRHRLAEDTETAANRGAGLVIVDCMENGETLYSMNYACPDCGVSIEELAPRMFSFNSPYGACPSCSGLGIRMRICREAIFPDERVTLREGAMNLMGFNANEQSGIAAQYFGAMGKKFGFTLDTPVEEIGEDGMKALLYGTGDEQISITYEGARGLREYATTFEGIIPTLERRYRETSSEAMKQAYEEYMAEEICPDCGGQRLKAEARAVTVNGKSLPEVSDMSILQAREFFAALNLEGNNRVIAQQILKEIDSRLGFLTDVGLGYLTLSRGAGTLSGGEAQRIRLATQIGSALMGVMYILDEPSIGLHQRDNARLLQTLYRLRDLGNTLVVVEHDEETMTAADHIIDIGPGAGINGGRVVCTGTAEEIMACPESVTGQYLSGKKRIPVPGTRREGNGRELVVYGASENNLKNLTVRFPLGKLICVTGVSGSGKSSLVQEILYKILASEKNRAKVRPGRYDRIEGLEYVDKVIALDQSPIGRTPRSNPATYTGVFDDIRSLFASTQDARMRGYQQGRFSFNTKGGRCEACSGDGLVRIEMHFLPDVYVPCEVCGGRRYNRETLEVRYKGKNIAEVLDMTVEEACSFFANQEKIHDRLQTLFDVGLGYIKLGQSSTTLSGGEAQRVKLATELSKRATGRTVYILDEPTTGLHVADVHRLTDILSRLTDAGNTVIVIEHNLDVIKVADTVIDLGPEGGDAGGELVFEGTPEECAACESSFTGNYLKKVLAVGQRGRD